jgi:hypothetical protein
VVFGVQTPRDLDLAELILLLLAQTGDEVKQVVGM